MEIEDLELLAEEAAELIGERHADGLCGNECVHLDLEVRLDRLCARLCVDDSLADTRLELVAELTGSADEENVHLLLDFLDAVLAEHLRSDREALPRLDPAPYQFEGQTIYLSGQIRRPDLEAQADALLAAAGDEGEGRS